ncbi:MAG: hypothetical protein FJX76_22465 [Armatimonadetes bacterium]|nr:hypothetical protein [Armatimonadota bacterium]
MTSASVANTPDGVAWVFGERPYDGWGNPIPGRYERLFKGGREGVRTGVKRVELPKTSDYLAQAAWGSSSPLPYSSGVFINSSGLKASGGVYVNGAVDDMTLAVKNGNSEFTIKQGATTTTVTEVRTTPITAPNGVIVPVNNTLMVSGAQVKILQGLPNGVVYVKGDIRGLKGQNKGNHTIAVDVKNGNEVVLKGNLYRSDTTLGAKPTGTADNLGVVAGSIRLPSASVLPRDTNNPLYVYAALLGGSDTRTGLVIDSATSGGLGTLALFGGMLINKRTTLGSVNSQGQQTNGYNLYTRFDPNLASQPPPWFPTISKLTLRGWTESAIVQ